MTQSCPARTRTTRDRRVDAAEFCAFFAEQAEKYDESVLTYTERSTVVTLSVTARGVQMKQAEREATAEEKAAAANPLLDSGRQYLIRVDQAAALLREIGICPHFDLIRDHF